MTWEIWKIDGNTNWQLTCTFSAIKQSKQQFSTFCHQTSNDHLSKNSFDHMTRNEDWMNLFIYLYFEVVSYLKMQSFDHITFFKQLQTFKKALLIIKMHHNQVSSSSPPHSSKGLPPLVATKMRKKCCLQIFYAEKKQQMLLTNFLFGLCPSAFRRDATKCSMLLFRAIPSFINKR